MKRWQACGAAWLAIWIGGAGWETEILAAPAAAPTSVDEAAEIVCEGAYAGHLQGVALQREPEAIFWSFTTQLVKTDAAGRLLKAIPAANHHGDLCVRDGRVYVAVNLGKFNQPPGKEDSWVYVYDAATLEEVARHPTPELVHGAGGIAWGDGKFLVVGGLPPGTGENYLYEYDSEFKFVQRHTLASGQTEKGIQTAEYADGQWWFGCYGSPQQVLKADQKFALLGDYPYDAALGIAHLGGNRFLIGRNKKTDAGYVGRLFAAKADDKSGFTPPKGR